MVQIVPNWASVSGRVESVDDAGDGNLRLRIRVDAADDVPGFANLLARTVGQTIDVEIGPGALGAPDPGDPFRARIRQTGVERYRAESSGPDVG